MTKEFFVNNEGNIAMSQIFIKNTNFISTGFLSSKSDSDICLDQLFFKNISSKNFQHFFDLESRELIIKNSLFLDIIFSIFYIN